jgi:hypothetical protein
LRPVDVPPPRGPVVILGTTFLRKYLAVFDFENELIGLGLINKNNVKSSYTFDDYVIDF